MSMKFIRNTRQKIVSASGAISLLLPWKVSFTELVDELDDHLDEALQLAGHAGRGAARDAQEQPQEQGGAAAA